MFINAINKSITLNMGTSSQCIDTNTYLKNDLNFHCPFY